MRRTMIEQGVLAYWYARTYKRTVRKDGRYQVPPDIGREHELVNDTKEIADWL